MRKLLPIALIFFLSSGYTMMCNGQDFGCPLEDGRIFPRSNGFYAHSDPTYVTTIVSIHQNNVRASLQGKVIDVIKSSGNLYTVIVRTGEITIAYKYMQKANVIKHQKIDFGSSIGFAQKADSAGYKLDISIWSGTEGMNASELLPCANK